MKVTGYFDFKNGSKVIDGVSLWDDNLQHRVGDVLVCGDKRWRVVAVQPIFQGCFSKPEWRHHELQLLPIDHDYHPNVDDVLVKV